MTKSPRGSRHKSRRLSPSNAEHATEDPFPNVYTRTLERTSSHPYTYFCTRTHGSARTVPRCLLNFQTERKVDDLCVPFVENEGCWRTRQRSRYLSSEMNHLGTNERTNEIRRISNNIVQRGVAKIAIGILFSFYARCKIITLDRTIGR